MSYQTYSPTTTSSGSPSKPPLLKFEDLTPQVGHDRATRQGPSFSAVDDSMNDQLRGRLTELRDENSSLVSQSHRLLGELEDTSHQLLVANRKIDSLNSELAKQRQKRDASTAEHHTTTSSGSALGSAEASGHTRRHAFTAPVGPDRLSSLLGKAGPGGGYGQPPEYVPQGAGYSASGRSGGVRALHTAKEQEEETLRDRLKQSLVLNEELRSLCVGHDREREQWRREQEQVQEQVQDLQEERRRLMESLSIAEERASGQASHIIGTGIYSRGSPSRTPLHSNPHKTTRREDVFNSTFASPSGKTETGEAGHFRPGTSERDRGSRYHGNLGFKSQPEKRQDLLKRTGSSEYLLFGGLEQGGRGTTGGPVLSSLSAGSLGYGGRSGSLQPLTGSHGDRHTGVGSGDSRLRIKLEAAETRLRQYENEVLFLERELKQKSDQAQQHVAELSSLQNELSAAREQARLNVERTERALEEEVDKVKRSLSLKASELEVQLDSCRLQVEHSEEEAERLRGELRQAQALLRVAEQGREEAEERLRAERDGHTHAVQRLSSEVDQGTSHVAQVEKSLEQCQGELQEHLLRAQEEAMQQERVAQLHQKEIASLKEQLTHCKSELRQHSALVKTLQKELEAARDEALAQCATGERLTGETKAYKEVLKERDVERTQLKADIMTLETKLKASQEECVRKEKDVQRQLRGMENNFGEQLRAMNQTRDKCKEFERSCSQLEMVRGTLERRVTALGQENEELRARLDAAERKEMELMRQRNEAEGRVKEGEAELKSRVTRLQQEVAHRAQQVAELDTLLRNHQADTAARRLQLERALAQRQADLRSRTQEVEDLTEQLREMERALEKSKLEMKGISSDALQKMEEKVEEIYKLQSGIDQLKREAARQEEEKAAVQSRLEEVRAELATKREGWRRLEEQWAAEKKKLMSEVEHLKEESGALQERYGSQLKSLQETHAQMLASQDQESASHRLQMQRTQEQDRQRNQETARIRAQVASLSSELAAERRVAEEARQQLAIARAEAARYQAQASSLQRALSTNNYASHFHAISTQPGPVKPTAAPINPGRGTTEAVSSSVPHGDAGSSGPQDATGSLFASVGKAQNHDPPPRETGSPGRESVMSDLAEFHSLPPPNLSPPSLNPSKTTPTQSTQFTGDGWSPHKKGDIIDV